MFPRSLISTCAMRVLAACGALSLSGCMLPTYTAAPGEPLATAKLYGFGKPFMCMDGKRYRLDTTTDEGGGESVRLPAGKRLTVWRYLSTSGYQTITSCHPALSLIPEQGATLAINSGLAGRQCFIEAVREDAKADTGIALDMSLGAPTC